MSTLDKNIVLRDCQRQAFEYLHQKLSHDRSLHDYVFWDYFETFTRTDARTDAWEIERMLVSFNRNYSAIFATLQITSYVLSRNSS